MAAKKELFWLGVGVKTIDGKDYGAGTPLPVDKIDKDDLKKMISDGRVGGMVEKIDAVCKGCAGHLDTIEAKNILIDKMKESVKELTAKVKENGDAADSAEELADLKKQKVELDAEVKRLTAELAEATKPKDEKK